MWRADSLKKTLMLGKIEGKRRRGDRRWDGWVESPTPLGHEFEQTPGDSEGQGSLVCCSPWGCKESDMTKWLNNSNVRREIKRGKGGGEAARFDSLESSQPPKTAKDAKIKSWLWALSRKGGLEIKPRVWLCNPWLRPQEDQRIAVLFSLTKAL